jgi:Transposase family tnp2
MMPLGIAAGPKAEKFNLDSYLFPLLDELRHLDKGVAAYDAYTQTYFSLQGYLCLITGDTPAISKLFQLSGHIGEYPCRACKVQGAPYLNRYITQAGPNKGNPGQQTRYYYPLSPPNKFPPHISAEQKTRTSQLTSYNSYIDLPLRNHDNYVKNGEMCTVDNTVRHVLGVKGVSPFAHLPTIKFPDSVPFDIMHLVFLNFVRDLCALFNGTYFKNPILNKHPSSLSPNEWTSLGVDMSHIESPTSWGRPPRDISKYIASFKAEDFNNFLLYYLLPLIHRRVPPTTFTALRRWILFVTTATSIEIRYTEMDLIDSQLRLFMDWFHDTFYQRDHERLPICKYTEHCIMHILRDLRNWGSATYYWQFPEVYSLQPLYSYRNRSDCVENLQEC